MSSGAAPQRSAVEIPRRPLSLGGVDVVPLRGRRDRARFVDLPYRLYRNEPNWVPLLRRDIRALIDPAKNPFFEHGEACFWLAWRGGVPVGRISAQINRLHLDTHRDETGNFGFLEAIDDVAVFAALLGAAETWLRERGMRRIVGPYSLSMNDDIGVLVAGFDTAPMVGMPHTPPYYAERLSALGYAKAKDVHALRLHRADFAHQRLEQIERATAQLRAQGRLQLRFLDPKRFSEEIKLAIDIYNDAWTENWGFLPVTEAEVQHLAKQLAPVLPADGVIFAIADGEPAGMLVALPDINEFLTDLNGRLLPLGWAKLLYRLRFRKPKGARIILLGVRRRYRGSALSSALVGLMLGEICKVGRAAAVETVELSWVLEDNKPSLEGCQALGARLAKTYRIFGKLL
ncbi:MAG TPA: dATP pyrophosphohydrolase [Stellaceae bacterium]|nr:dATP pyrophosphohydrolase [Stellaceae bacterium]